MNTYDVVVIGAGITGASTAYYLKKSGVKKGVPEIAAACWTLAT